METIDDYWAQYCAMSRHGDSFVDFLQRREAFGIGAHIWQLLSNDYEKYVRDTFDVVNFYIWLKHEELILN